MSVCVKLAAKQAEQVSCFVLDLFTFHFAKG